MFKRVATALVVLIVALTPFWLPGLGTFLVKAGEPVKADAILVLGGDQFGERILKAAELARQGYASRVYVSGPVGIFDYYESDLSIPFAKKHGYTDVEFRALPNECKSTVDEANELLPKLKADGHGRILLVTSNYHSRRAGSIMRRNAQGLDLHVVAAPAREYDPPNWWKRRQDRKNFFYEWSKTVAYWIGM